ncbi:MAG: hypothetical protein ABIS14_00095 [Sphingomonas sp.]
MTHDQAVRTARRIFTFAAIYGAIVLLPVYFSEPMLARAGRAETHPEFLYGFVGAALAFQLVYAVIGRDPERFRPLMPVAVIAKLTFFVPCAILFGQARLGAATFGFACGDLLLAILFAAAWRITRPA